jgi:hypothetical protein
MMLLVAKGMEMTSYVCTSLLKEVSPKEFHLLLEQVQMLDGHVTTASKGILPIICGGASISSLCLFA